MRQKRLDLSTCSNRVQPEIDRSAHVNFLKTVTKQVSDSNVRTLSKAKSKHIKPDKLNIQRSRTSKKLVLIPSIGDGIGNPNNKHIINVIPKKRTLPTVMSNVVEANNEYPVIVNESHKHNVSYRMLDFWGHDTTMKNSTHRHMIRMSHHMCDHLSNPLDTNVAPDYTQSRTSSAASGRCFSPEVFTGMRNRSVSPEGNIGTLESHSMSPESPDGIPWGRARSMYNNKFNHQRFSCSPEFWEGDTRTRETILRRIQKDFIRSPYIINGF